MPINFDFVIFSLKRKAATKVERVKMLMLFIGIEAELLRKELFKSLIKK